MRFHLGHFEKFSDPLAKFPPNENLLDSQLYFCILRTVKYGSQPAPNQMVIYTNYYAYILYCNSTGKYNASDCYIVLAGASVKQLE